MAAWKIKSRHRNSTELNELGKHSANIMRNIQSSSANIRNAMLRNLVPKRSSDAIARSTYDVVTRQLSTSAQNVQKQILGFLNVEIGFSFLRTIQGQPKRFIDNASSLLGKNSKRFGLDCWKAHVRFAGRSGSEWTSIIVTPERDFAVSYAAVAI